MVISKAFIGLSGLFMFGQMDNGHSFCHLICWHVFLYSRLIIILTFEKLRLHFVHISMMSYISKLLHNLGAR
jgi:hypothetical protein